MQTAHSLGYGQGQEQWVEMGWSTKPRFKTALVGNWFEDGPTPVVQRHAVRAVRGCVCVIWITSN